MKAFIKIILLSLCLSLTGASTAGFLEKESVQKYETDLYYGQCVITTGLISTHKTCDIYLSEYLGGPDMQENASAYQTVLRLIRNMAPDDKFILHLDGYGGRVDIYHAFEKAVHMTKGEFDTELDGNVYSAHAMLLVLGQHIIVKENHIIMFHMPYNVGSKGEIIKLCKPKMSILDRITLAEFSTKISPYLNAEEYDQLIHCQDVYITAKDLIVRVPNQVVNQMPVKHINSTVSLLPYIFEVVVH